MKTYLLTIYSIKTNVAFIEAESLEEAQQTIADQGDSIRWMQIPRMNYLSWCEDGKPIGADFNKALENYDPNTNHKDNYDK